MRQKGFFFAFETHPLRLSVWGSMHLSLANSKGVNQDVNCGAADVEDWKTLIESVA